MKRKLPLKPLDSIIILLAAAMIFFSAYSIYVKPQTTATVLIKGTDGNEWIFPLDAEETIAVPGPLGNTVIRISGSQAWVQSSPCKNQVCVASGLIHRQGAWAACLPNYVLIAIQGDEQTIDASAW